MSSFWFPTIQSIFGEQQCIILFYSRHISGSKKKIQRLIQNALVWQHCESKLEEPIQKQLKNTQDNNSSDIEEPIQKQLKMITQVINIYPGIPIMYPP